MGYIALVLLILITGLLLMFNCYLKISAETITELIETMNVNIQKEDYDTAYKNFSDIKKEWEKREKIIHLTVESDELDDINITIREIEAFFENNTFEEFYEKSYNLNFSINHLYEKNKLNIETIF